MKLFNNIALIITVLVLGALIGWYFSSNFNPFQKQKEEKATVLLEKIKNVTKLITVEGSLSEIYSYKDFYSYDISPLRKQALIRVTAKVSAGYDFDKLQINVNSQNKKVVISNFPKAEILSIDHDLDYYDLTEGVFNGFETGDFNKMNASAKERIKNAALSSDLLLQAESQKNNLIEMIEILLSGSGYSLEVLDDNTRALN